MPSDHPISYFPDASIPLTGTELLVCVQEGQTRKTLVRNIGGSASVAFHGALGHSELGSPQVIPAHTGALATLFAMEFDSDSFWSPASPAQLVPKPAGLFNVMFNLSVSSGDDSASAGQSVQAELQTLFDAFVRGGSATLPDANGAFIVFAMPVQCPGTAPISVFVQNDTDADIAIQQFLFSAVRIADTQPLPPPPPPPFDPPVLDYLLYLDGNLDLWQTFGGTDPVTATGQNVTYWTNQRGPAGNAGNNDFVASYPTALVPGQNGLNAVAFDGVNADLHVPDSVDLALVDFTIFVVFSGTVSGGSAGLACKGNNGSATAVNFYIYVNGGGVFFYTGYGAGADGPASIFGLGDGQPYIVAFRSSAAGLNGWLNGADYVTVPRSNDPVANSERLNIGSLGCCPIFPFAGMIASVVLINGALDDTDMATLFTFLNSRWGVY